MCAYPWLAINVWRGPGIRCLPKAAQAPRLTNCRITGSPTCVQTPGSPFVFGVDPAWHGTRTELSFLNSMKMKMSILLGVVQVRYCFVALLLLLSRCHACVCQPLDPRSC